MERQSKAVPTGLKQLRIPVFVSRPLKLTPSQGTSLRIIERCLARLRFEPRTYASEEFPNDNPISEVRALARICSGGVILGFRKHADQQNRRRNDQTPPTPWNHIEAGILYSLGVPLWILREPGEVSTGSGITHTPIITIFRFPYFF